MTWVTLCLRFTTYTVQYIRSIENTGPRLYLFTTKPGKLRNSGKEAKQKQGSRLHDWKPLTWEARNASGISQKIRRKLSISVLLNITNIDSKILSVPVTL